MKRLESYLDSGFSWDQLIEIGWGIEHQLTDEQIASFADPAIDAETICALRLALEENRNQEKQA